jgi:hypothetical protein
MFLIYEKVVGKDGPQDHLDRKQSKKFMMMYHPSFVLTDDRLQKQKQMPKSHGKMHLVELNNNLVMVMHVLMGGILLRVPKSIIASATCLRLGWSEQAVRAALGLK